MERDVHGMPTARYLWDEKNVVPVLKVDKGLAAEQDGVQFDSSITQIYLASATKQPLSS